MNVLHEVAKDKLIKHLHENDCYNEFMYNLENPDLGGDEFEFYTIDDLIKEYPRDPIWWAFNWTESPEGYDYWEDIAYD